MNILKVGIAGFGVVGARRKDCIGRDGRMRVAAVCDRNFADEGTLPDGIRTEVRAGNNQCPWRVTGDRSSRMQMVVPAAHAVAAALPAC